MNQRGMHAIFDGTFEDASSDSTYFNEYNKFSTVGACQSLSFAMADLVPIPGQQRALHHHRLQRLGWIQQPAADRPLAVRRAAVLLQRNAR